ncbi:MULTISPECIES: pantoate--beta-alanine ligase [unclassified Nocardioides]|uniref:pantoate--beta-alanine ligase n=1 Tax=unclassified Nocardioides TaxID=2615069 RepID=UPI000701F306|nr:MULTISPECIES: pantoate--beta-alanine ligase [unclassified Nocardioides]KQY50212.1 pantoate--beta-alanine ligase [Nocardioides sp. Root140]KRF14908.1 pantoate--beta-alanine ligase [Nocardioides sp. Soil796]
MTSTPVLASTREELLGLLADARGAGKRVGFVPTMGALHVGHASLMEAARAEVGDGPVVVSIFVNPLQFGAGEDLDRYPRTLDADLALCGEHGVDIVFAPAVDEVYPGSVDGVVEPQVTLDPGPLGSILEGATRPGHFRGVLIVVAKLFGLVRPDVAVFGQKDYQQLALIRRMVDDLCMGIEVVGGETVREPDGLALSSRNRYLEPADREHAVALSRTLLRARENAMYGADSALAAARAELRASDGVDLDYLVITGTDLGPAPAHGEARVIIAARVGSTRLIDNMPVHLGTADHPEPSAALRTP